MFLIDNNLLFNYKNLLNFKNLNCSKIYRKTYFLFEKTIFTGKNIFFRKKFLQEKY